MSFRNSADRINRQTEAKRKHWQPEPDGTLVRIYRWWEANTVNIIVRPAYRRNNLCHFLRVVLIWAPLQWLGSRKIVRMPLAMLALGLIIVAGIITCIVRYPLGTAEAVLVIIATASSLAYLVLVTHWTSTFMYKLNGPYANSTLFYDDHPALYKLGYVVFLPVAILCLMVKCLALLMDASEDLRKQFMGLRTRTKAATAIAAIITVAVIDVILYPRFKPVREVTKFIAVLAGMILVLVCFFLCAAEISIHRERKHVELPISFETAKKSKRTRSRFATICEFAGLIMAFIRAHKAGICPYVDLPLKTVAVQE